MKKTVLVVFVILIILVGIGAAVLFLPATKFSVSEKFLYVRNSNTAKSEIMEQIDTGNVIRFAGLFGMLADRVNIWDRITDGRFRIEKGTSLFNLIRELRNNKQSPVRFTINKIRTREDLAMLIGKKFSTDSLKAIHFLDSNDSLSKLNVDSNTWMTLIIPDTYFLNWNLSTEKILDRFERESEKFWNSDDRKEKAAAMGFSPEQIYIIASIVEEETNKNDEKGHIASVYINRLDRGMPLGADPTIKFALKDFSLKRILYGHLNVVSPYNTYRNKGLPPGPICTPSRITIDAVLNAPKTNYLFFVASSEFNGYHHFSDNFAEHQQYARMYQRKLDSLLSTKKK